MSTITITTIASYIVLIITVNLVEVKADSVGVNFGRQTSQKLLPSTVVDMCLANGIEKVKFFSINDAVLTAFTRSNIQVIVSIPNVEMFLINGLERARVWVHRNITRYIKEKGVDIKYVGIGVEPFSKIELDKGDTSFIPLLPQYVQHTNIGLKEDGFEGKVRVTIPHATDVLKQVEKPSDGDFREDIKEKMIEILEYQDVDEAPFMINIYPLLSVIQENRSIEFGLFDGKHNESIKDGNLTYTNMFDFKYDTLLWALRKNNFKNMKIIVGQIGWPTDGSAGATIENAKRFYDGFLKKIARNKGTPLQPGVKLDVYFYSLVDENQRDIVKRAPFERHYGIYTFDGKPKFNINFTLQGRDFKPQSAQGITYLPERWCVLNKDAAKGKDKLVGDNFQKACTKSDCSLLSNGSSCSGMDYLDQVSYAFNMDFQMNNQDMVGEMQACNYDGLGKIVYKKPETGDCDFPVQILSTLFTNSLSVAEMAATLGITPNGQERLNSSSPLIVILVLALLCFFLY